MRAIDYSQIETLQAAARRERSQYVYCLLVRASQWLAARLPGRTALGIGPCCEPA